MKRFLFATVFALAAGPALADTIVATAKVDNVLVATQTSASGTLNVSNQSFGPIFNLNSLSINSESFLASPDILATNTLDVNQTVGGTHTLVIDIVAAGLAGPNALTNFLSSFSVSGMNAGWSAQEQTFINNVLLADTGVFTATSDSAFSVNPAFAGTLFNAEVIYTINTVGTGRFNGGIDISVAAVPEPATWGMMLLGFVGLAFAFRNRRKLAGMPA
jgi:PEP-CTERM motif